jgi:hypothetical protein
MFLPVAVLYSLGGINILQAGYCLGKEHQLMRKGIKENTPVGRRLADQMRALKYVSCLHIIVNVVALCITAANPIVGLLIWSSRILFVIATVHLSACCVKIIINQYKRWKSL